MTTAFLKVTWGTIVVTTDGLLIFLSRASVREKTILFIVKCPKCAILMAVTFL